jgi:molecular chaperone GrpE
MPKKKHDSVTAEQTKPAEEIKTEANVAQTVNTETAPADSSGNGLGHPAEAAPSAAAVEEQLEQARQEAAKNLDGWQRAAAELANYKRRQEEQTKLQRDMIKADVLQGVISALDDLDLAFQNLPKELNGQLVGWVEGFRLVQRKLDRILDDQGVTAITTQGEFNPNLHEAVSHEDSPDHQEGQIIGELRKGYQIGNRVIRPALVRVAK